MARHIEHVCKKEEEVAQLLSLKVKDDDSREVKSRGSCYLKSFVKEVTSIIILRFRKVILGK